MRVDRSRVVRPTLRCLFEDLAGDVGPKDISVAVANAPQAMAADRHYLFPTALTTMDHPILAKASQIAAGPSATRERISVISDRVTTKVKTSDRRGAMWQDQDGTWWLLAAGRRKDDGSGDFYRGLERFKSDSDPIAPSEADYRYLRFENAYLDQLAIDRQAHSNVVAAVLAAAADPGASIDTEVFGAVLSVVIEPADDLGQLSVSFDFQNFDDQHRFPVDVIGFIPGRESLDDWDFLPALSDGDPSCWYTYVSHEWVDWLTTAVELDVLLGHGWTAPQPSNGVAHEYAHRAAGSVVTLAYIEGVEITALCGARFAPWRDPEKFPECPACAKALELLRQKG